ncbi:MAG: PilZ domain-containing protein, partial [Desulfomonilaceae bacterium]
MAEKRHVNGTNIINDLRSGMADWELQVKYKLSSQALETIFKRLVARNAISHAELYECSPFYKERTDGIKPRAHCRADLPLYVPVRDTESSKTGVLRDISEKGLRVAGIEVSVGRVKTFEVPVDLFVHAPPLLVKAECKWVEAKGKITPYAVAGFEVIGLSEGDSKLLSEFTRLL